MGKVIQFSEHNNSSGHELNYMGRTPEEILGALHDLDDYIACFDGLGAEGIDLSNQIIDNMLRQCTGYTPAEQRRRAKWLKAEMARRLMAENRVP